MNVESGNSNSENYFYEMMEYPVPLFFDGKNFSWKEKNPFLEEYLQFIHQWRNLYRNLPFVKKIYLCNSLTFNALNENSDIDVFIITEEKRIWSARFFCLFLFSWFHIKRSSENKIKKFCLSFFVTEEHQNLDAIALDGGDPYLEYRCKHLTLLYQENKKKNQTYLPFLSCLEGCKLHQISLGNQVFEGRGIFKKIVEFLLGRFFGDIFEYLVAIPQKFLIYWKIKKNPKINKDVIVSDVMLKFYQDKREEYRKKMRG